MESVQEGADGISARIRAFPRAWSRLERSWHFTGEAVRIRDRVLESGRSGARSTARLHFHPDVPLRGKGGAWEAGGLRVAFEGAGAVRNVEYLYAPEFNVRIPARCLEIDFDSQLVTVLGP